LTVLSINDFHGNLQATEPVPARVRVPDAAGAPGPAQAAGGAAHFATAVAELRRQYPKALFVAAGDLIGGSPQISALLRDQPTLVALSDMGLMATALGNHELDAGLPELLRQARGECAPTGCLWPDFKAPSFPYLAANLLDAETGRRLLPSHVIREVDGVKVAIVGVVTRDTPLVTVARSIKGLKFAEEVATLNALVPQLRAEGAQVLLAVMHEGGGQGSQGSANDASYACPGLEGRGVEIAKGLDPAYAMLIQGHTHQAYTCKIDGRLVVQGGSYGAWITESHLKIAADGRVLEATAVNRPVLQSAYAPNPALAALVARAAQLTAAARNRPVTTLAGSARRSAQAPLGDSLLGNLIADSQLAYARERGGADLAFMNSGGIRADLIVEPGRPVTMGDLMTIQPFGNELIVLTMSGEQLKAVLQRQLPKSDSSVRFLQPSTSLKYTWRVGSDGQPVLGPVSILGRPLDEKRDYRVVVNNFLAEGGDAQSGFRAGRDRVTLGADIDALVEYLSRTPDALERAAPGRIRKE
jgi:5'-nucleotidase